MAINADFEDLSGQIESWFATLAKLQKKQLLWINAGRPTTMTDPLTQEPGFMGKNASADIANARKQIEQLRRVRRSLTETPEKVLGGVKGWPLDRVLLRYKADSQTRAEEIAGFQRIAMGEQEKIVGLQNSHVEPDFWILQNAQKHCAKLEDIEYLQRQAISNVLQGMVEMLPAP